MSATSYLYNPVSSTKCPRPEEKPTLPLLSVSVDQINIHDSRPSTAPAPKSEVPKKPRKAVRFSSAVVDNEHRMRSRLSKSPTGPRNLLKPSSSQQSALYPSSKISEANTSAKRKTPTSSSSRDTPRALVDHSNHSTKAQSVKFHKLLEESSAHRSIHVPPRVPDAPELPGPPPAPRPARLPTPDLPEIYGEKMFPPLSARKQSLPAVRDSRSRPVHSKVDAQSKLSDFVDNLIVADQKSGSGSGIYAGEADGECKES